MRWVTRLITALTTVLVLGGCASEPPPAPVVAATAPAPHVAVPADVTVGEPTRIEIPAIGVDSSLVGVGLKSDGAMQTPDFGGVGWYDLGPRPGAPGPAVVLAHVRGPAGPDVFAHLADLRPGDTVVVHRTDGASTFVVESSEQVAKEALPYDRIWTSDDTPSLRLITCGGTPGPNGFPDNTVVYLRAV